PCFKQKGAGGEHSSRRRPIISPLLPLYRLLLLPLIQQKGNEGKNAPPGSEHSGGGGSGSDAVTISPSPPLRPSHRRRDTQHATQKAKSDDGLAKTREASSPAKDRRRADRRRFQQRERTNPKEERRYSGEETTGAVKVTDGHAISDTTKQVTFLEG
ncbi:hypothetical protein LINPERPRIM_LOCUS26452, partial [Linum perenne]